MSAESQYFGMVAWTLSDEIKDFTKLQRKTPHRKNHSYQLLALPDYPWQKVASDLFGKTYLLVADYYSRFPEVIKLTSTTAQIITVAW
jgi:hypothetical protein